MIRIEEIPVESINEFWTLHRPLGKLMQNFRCKNPDEMHYKLLAEQTRYYKESEEGEKAMCRIMEELIDSRTREIAVDLMRKGKLTKEDVMEIFGFSLEEASEMEKEAETVSC